MHPRQIYDTRGDLTTDNARHSSAACSGYIELDRDGRWIQRPCKRTHGFNKSCFECWRYGDQHLRNFREALYRAMGNMALVGLPLWWITVRLDNPPIDAIENATALAQKWASFRRAWNRGSGGHEYVRIVSMGDNDFVHWHIIATAPPPEFPSLNIDYDPVDGKADENDSLEKSIANVANYMTQNAATLSTFDFYTLTASRTFWLWSESHIFHYVDICNLERTNAILQAPQETALESAKIPFCECSHCGRELPHTSTFFYRNGDYLRRQCIICWKYVNAATKANRRAAAHGIGQCLTWQDIRACYERQGFRVGKGNDLSCHYTGDRLPFADASIDHITPLSDGGKNAPDNLCVTFQRWNVLKSDRTPEALAMSLAIRGIRCDHLPDGVPVQQRLFASA